MFRSKGLLILVSAAVAALALACSEPDGDGGGGGGGGGDDPAGIDGTATINALCSYLTRCENTLGPLFPSEAACLQMFSEGLDDCVPLRFDSTQAEVDACTSFLTSAACGITILDESFEDTPCGGLDTIDPDGTARPAPVGLGELCDISGCVDGTFCDYGVPAGTCEVCVNNLAVGVNCSNNGECVDGAFCWESFYGGDDLCTALRNNGDSCAYDLECNSGWCNFSSQCADPIARGAACTSGEDCAGHTWCNGSICADLAGPAAACTDSGQCQLGLVCVGMQCTAAATCGSGALGDACMGDGCGAGLACDIGTTNTCGALNALGTSCNWDDPCEADLICWEWDFTCQQPGTVGTNCSRDGDCADPLFCNFNTTMCSTPIAANGSCANYETCEAGTFCDFNSFTCIPPVGNGEFCYFGEMCSSGWCDETNNVCVAEFTCSMP